MAYRLLTGAAVSALLLAGTANADDGWGRRGGGWDRDYSYGYSDRHRDRHHRRSHDDSGEDAALLIGGAIVGLAIGSMLSNNSSSSSSSSYYSSPSYGYSEPSYAYGYSEPSYGYSTQSYNYAAPVQPTYVGSTGCTQVRSGRTATGAVIGGVIGGLIGNGVAADKNRGEGTAVGAALGSVIGGSIGSTSADCATSAYQGGYTNAGYTYGQQDVYGGLGQGQPQYEPYYEPDDQLYGGPSSGSSYSGPAAEECERVMRVTTLPDGREIHEPVEVCRQAHYGDWSVRN